MLTPSVDLPPPPYSSVVTERDNASSRQFLALHQFILQQEQVLDDVQNTLHSSKFDGALEQRRQDLIVELQNLYLKRKQLTAVLVRHDWCAGLSIRRAKLESEIASLTSLLVAARRTRDVDVIQVLSAQIGWKRLKVELLVQKLEPPKRRISVGSILQSLIQRPKTVAGVLCAIAVFGKLGLGPFRVVCGAVWRMVWFVSRQLLVLGRPRLWLNFGVLLLLSRWFSFVVGSCSQLYDVNLLLCCPLCYSIH